LPTDYALLLVLLLSADNLQSMHANKHFIKHYCRHKMYIVGMQPFVDPWSCCTLPPKEIIPHLHPTHHDGLYTTPHTHLAASSKLAVLLIRFSVTLRWKPVSVEPVPLPMRIACRPNSPNAGAMDVGL
jgi:hypothetical protein